MSPDRARLDAATAVQLARQNPAALPGLLARTDAVALVRTLASLVPEHVQTSDLLDWIGSPQWGPPRKLKPHGTVNRWRDHVRRDEPVCSACAHVAAIRGLHERDVA